MHFLIVGGSGQTGKLVIALALRHGHAVTALVRTPSSLAAQPGLTIVAGSPLSPSDIAAAFAATPSPVDAVIVTLRLATTSSSPLAPLVPGSPAHLGADAVRNLLEAMARLGVGKIVLLSAQGTAGSFAALSPLHKALFRWSNMRHQFADHDEVDKIVRAAAAGGSVDFVLVRPVMMVDGEAAEVKDHGDDGKDAGFMPKISRESVAAFIVGASESPDFHGRSPVISN